MCVCMYVFTSCMALISQQSMGSHNRATNMPEKCVRILFNSVQMALNVHLFVHCLHSGVLVESRVGKCV